MAQTGAVDSIPTGDRRRGTRVVGALQEDMVAEEGMTTDLQGAEAMTEGVKGVIGAMTEEVIGVMTEEAIGVMTEEVIGVMTEEVIGVMTEEVIGVMTEGAIGTNELIEATKEIMIEPLSEQNEVMTKVIVPHTKEVITGVTLIRRQTERGWTAVILPGKAQETATLPAHPMMKGATNR
jgi:hypothetical protein